MRSRLMLAPLLALLALVLSPTIGRAEPTSGDKVYHPEIEGIESEPELKGHPTTPTTHGSAPHADTQDPAPSAGSEEGAASVPRPGGEPRSEEHHRGHAAPSGKGGGRPPGDGGSSEGATKSVAHTQTHPMPTATGTSKSSDGGSSPVLLILIAIAVLALGSVGIALYRERKQAGNAEGYPES